MEIIEAKFDYTDLETETRISLKSRAEKIGERTRRIASDIWENGREFYEAQQELASHGNGRFLAWVESETGYSKSTVYRMIDVYQRFDFPNLGKTDIATSALYLLASSSTPEEARQQVIESASRGATITYSKAKKVIESHKHPMSEAEQDAIIQANNEEFYRRQQERQQTSRLDQVMADVAAYEEEAESTYTYTAEIEQYVEAVDAGEPVGNLMADRIKANDPRPLAIWELESAVYAWCNDYFGHNKIQAHYNALDGIRSGRHASFLSLLERYIIHTSYASTEPKPAYRANDLKQAINNVIEQLRQRLEERKANAVILDEFDALWEVRLYLENAERELKRLAKKHEGVELIGGAVTAVCSSINLSVAELKRAIKGRDEEE